MLCPVCHGTCLMIVQGMLVPCSECQGRGEVHCCDGLQEQPREEEHTRAEETDEDD